MVCYPTYYIPLLTKGSKSGISSKLVRSDPTVSKPESKFETNELPKRLGPFQEFTSRRRIYRGVKMYQNRKRSFSETDLTLKSKAKSDAKNSKKQSEFKRKKTEKYDSFSTKKLSNSDIHKIANSNRKSRKSLTAKEVDNGNLKKIIAQGRHGNSIEIRTSRFNSKNINVLTLQNQYVVQNQANLGYFFSNSTAFKVLKCVY